MIDPRLFLYMIFQMQGILSQILELDVITFFFFSPRSTPAAWFSPFLLHTALNVPETLLVLLWKVGKGERQFYTSLPILSTRHQVVLQTQVCLVKISQESSLM